MKAVNIISFTQVALRWNKKSIKVLLITFLSRKVMPDRRGHDNINIINKVTDKKADP